MLPQRGDSIRYPTPYNKYHRFPGKAQGLEPSDEISRPAQTLRRRGGREEGKESYLYLLWVGGIVSSAVRIGGGKEMRLRGSGSEIRSDRGCFALPCLALPRAWNKTRVCMPTTSGEAFREILVLFYCSFFLSLPGVKKEQSSGQDTEDTFPVREICLGGCHWVQNTNPCHALPCPSNKHRVASTEYCTLFFQYLFVPRTDSENLRLFLQLSFR
jgi:hypothetical protein